MPYYSTLFIDVILKNESREKVNPWYYYEVEIDTLPATNNFVIGMMIRPELGTGSEIELKMDQQDYDILPGETQDSLGFSMKTGELMYNGVLEYTFNMEKIITTYNKPHRIKEYIESEQLRLQGKKKKKGPDQNELDIDRYDFKGDTVGIAYNAKTGRYQIIKVWF
jgi:hypothetical protein